LQPSRFFVFAIRFGIKDRISKQKLEGGGERFSFESKEKQKTFFYRRKSSKCKLKQECSLRFRAGQRSWPCCAQGAQGKTAGQTEK